MYKKGHSRTTALTEMTVDWLKEKKREVVAVLLLLDLSSASDILDHKLLLNKLSRYGFESSAAAWVKSYLTGRKYI